MSKDELRDLNSQIDAVRKECMATTSRSHGNERALRKLEGIKADIDFLKAHLTIPCPGCSTPTLWKELHETCLQNDGIKVEGFLCKDCLKKASNGLEIKEKPPGDYLKEYLEQHPTIVNAAGLGPTVTFA